MKYLSALSVVLLLSLSSVAQTLCNTSGNVVVFSNYDGGALTINVDVNIPNLKIGICTYESCAITITGPFAGNVTAVRYAGFNGQNDHCGLGTFNTYITGVPSNITTILFAPPATMSDPNGYGSIICGYSCGTSNQGGCNTASQVADYFTDTFGGELYMYYTQYGCWPASALSLSAGGNCCPGTTGSAPVAAFSPSDSSICPGDCITFTNQSTGNPTSYTWSFPGGSPASSSSANPGTICYAAAGTYTATLTATNANGSTIAASSIQVGPCDVPGCTYSEASNYNPQATVDNGSCIFGDCAGCPADLDDNAIIGINDLLMFIALFGTACPE